MHKMHKKATAAVLAMSMVLSAAMAAMAGEAVTEADAANNEAEAVATVGDDAEIKEALEEKVDDVTDENGDFEEDKLKELMAALFGPEEGEEAPDLGKEIEKGIEEGIAVVKQIDEAIDQHLEEEFADSIEKGDETICSHTIADIDFHEDETLHILGYFSLTNYDVDKDCPDDLVMKNYAGQPELLELTPDADGKYAVTNCVAAEDGEGYSDSVAAMCEDIEMDLDKFYEAMALTDLTYLVDLYNFMDEHEQYDHIEYTGEMKTKDELGDAIGDEFTAYLKLFAVDMGLIDADELAEEEEKVELRELVGTFISDIEKAAAEVDLKEKEAATGTEYSEKGTVFTLLEDILKDVDAKEAQASDAVNKILEGLASLDEAQEGELDDLLSLGVVGLLGEVDEIPDEDDMPSDAEAANLVASFVYETAKENEQIAGAVEATGSRLFEVLANSSNQLKELLNDDGTMNVVKDAAEEPFTVFEEELAKVRDYIAGQDGPKQAALDVLDLLHQIVDDIHFSVHGHTHVDQAQEAVTEQAEAMTE